MQPTEKSSTTFTLRPLATSTPAANLEPIGEAKPIVTEQSEAPIDMYEAKWGRPYITDLYDMSGLGDFAKEELRSVNTYVLNEIKDRGLALTKKSYEAILADLETTLGIDPNVNYDEKLKKVKAYVDILATQKRLELRKKLLENVQN